MTPDVLDALYREHGAAIVKDVERVLGGSKRLAEDCVHDACVKLLDHHGPVEFPRQLLRVAAINRARDLMRRCGSLWDKRTGDVAALSEHLVGHESPETEMILTQQQEAQRDEVRMALSLIPEQLASAVWRHHSCGMTLAEIARQDGVPESIVRARLHRGRARLRDILQRDPRDDQ